MFAPISLTNQGTSHACEKCGVNVQVASLTTLLEITGVDFQEWDDTEFNLPYRISEDAALGRPPGPRERRFFEWSRGHGLTDGTVFTLLSNNIKRIATLRNTPTDFLDKMELPKGQKAIIRALMMEDWCCSFCGTYHTSPKNSCSMISRPNYSGESGRSSSGSLKSKGERQRILDKRFKSSSSKSKLSVNRCKNECNSLPGEELMDSDFEEEPLIDTYISRGRRNTTGENYGYLNCHPKYWADILPVPTKLIKML